MHKWITMIWISNYTQWSRGQINPHLNTSDLSSLIPFGFILTSPPLGYITVSVLVFNKTEHDRVQMCFSDVRLETQAAALHWPEEACITKPRSDTPEGWLGIYDPEMCFVYGIN